MTTYEEAVILASTLKSLSPAIRGIELFGSVLSKGSGRDADFLILVDEETAKEWWQSERESIRVRWPDALYSKRWIVKKFFPFLYNATVHKRRNQRLLVAAAMLDI